MKAYKGLAALVLALALCLSPALALEGEHGFVKTHHYPGFHDVTGRWCEPYVRTCVEYGLLEGRGNGFAPQAQLTQGEAAALAVRIHCTLNGTDLPGPTQPWYQGSVDYLAGIGVTVPAPSANVTREGFFRMLAGVVPQESLTPINTITALPDTTDPAVLAFYNAGILTGVDPFGTFQGAGPLTREECAAMSARLADPAQRRRFTPAGQTPAGALAPDTVLLTVNGVPVPYGDYEDQLLALVREVQGVYLEHGMAFSWEGQVGVDWGTYFHSATIHSLTAQVVAAQQAQQVGCTQEELAATLFGPPTQAQLQAAALSFGLDLSQPEQAAFAAELVLEEQLNAQLALWVEAAQVVLTPEADTLDPLAIGKAHFPES